MHIRNLGGSSSVLPPTAFIPNSALLPSQAFPDFNGLDKSADLKIAVESCNIRDMGAVPVLSCNIRDMGAVPVLSCNIRDMGAVPVLSSCFSLSKKCTVLIFLLRKGVTASVPGQD